MANIGSFKKVGNEFQGEIVTLSVQTKGVRIVQETSRGTTTPPAIACTSAGPIMRSEVLCGAALLEPRISAGFVMAALRIIPRVEGAAPR